MTEGPPLNLYPMTGDGSCHGRPRRWWADVHYADHPDERSYAISRAGRAARERITDMDHDRRRLRQHLKQISPLGVAARTGRVIPYAGGFLDFLDAVGKSGPSRAAWRVLWKVADGLALDPDEVAVFQRHTGRTTPPTDPAREVWCIAARRSGKSEQTVARACWRAISRDWSAVLSRGERGVIPIIAADRDQARNTLAYLKGLARDPLVAPFVATDKVRGREEPRILRDRVEFKTGVDIVVRTCSYRTTRGYTLIDCIGEELSFWSTEGAGDVDTEVLNAVRPAMLTTRRYGARLTAITTPYARRGEVWKAYERAWARDDSTTLVWVADTLSMNPTVDAAEIEEAFAEDPQVAASEYGTDGLVSFRSDVEAYISREAIEACTIPGRLELPAVNGIRYQAFVDPSGGSSDSFTLAIAHAESNRAVLDCVREIRPPFSPDSAVGELVETLKAYRIISVVGDAYAGEWPRERFRVRGIEYRRSERSKSDCYREWLPMVNAARCELLSHPKLRTQALALERRTGRGTGKDTVDHRPGAHDDLINAVAGVLVLVGSREPGTIGPGDLLFGSDDGTSTPHGVLRRGRLVPYSGSGLGPPVEYDELGN